MPEHFIVIIDPQVDFLEIKDGHAKLFYDYSDAESALIEALRRSAILVTKMPEFEESYGIGTDLLQDLWPRHCIIGPIELETPPAINDIALDPLERRADLPKGQQFIPPPESKAERRKRLKGHGRNKQRRQQ